MTQTDNTSGTVAKPMLLEDEENLRSIGSFAEALEALKDAGVEVHSTEEFGHGFKVLATSDKSRLVDTPFVIMGYRLNDSKLSPDGFSSVFLVTETGEKWILNDGGTGIHAQLAKYAEHGITQGIMVPQGLVQSDYEWTDENGRERPGTTFYFSA